FLRESIASVLNQTYSHLEFVIVDDGSTDDSPQIIREYAARDGRIRPLVTGNHGAQRARNLGVAEAQGEFIAHLDQDNIALPERLAAQLSWICKHDLDVCGSSLWVIGESEYVRWNPEQHQDILHEFLFRTALVHSTTMLRAHIANANP